MEFDIPYIVITCHSNRDVYNLLKNENDIKPQFFIDKNELLNDDKFVSLIYQALNSNLDFDPIVKATRKLGIPTGREDYRYFFVEQNELLCLLSCGTDNKDSCLIFVSNFKFEQFPKDISNNFIRVSKTGVQDYRKDSNQVTEGTYSEINLSGSKEAIFYGIKLSKDTNYIGEQIFKLFRNFVRVGPGRYLNLEKLNYLSTDIIMLDGGFEFPVSSRKIINDYLSSNDVLLHLGSLK